MVVFTDDAFTKVKDRSANKVASLLEEIATASKEQVNGIDQQDYVPADGLATSARMLNQQYGIPFCPLKKAAKKGYHIFFNII